MRIAIDVSVLDIELITSIPHVSHPVSCENYVRHYPVEFARTSRKVGYEVFVVLLSLFSSIRIDGSDLRQVQGLGVSTESPVI
jgi:hypothetical protein